MSHVVKNNRGFLPFLANGSDHQHQFFLRTATPQQVHALLHIYNVLAESIPCPETTARVLRSHKDVLVNLAEQNVPYKTKKQILAQEGGGFIQDLLAPVVTSWAF